MRSIIFKNINTSVYITAKFLFVISFLIGFNMINSSVHAKTVQVYDAGAGKLYLEMCNMSNMLLSRNVPNEMNIGAELFRVGELKHLGVLTKDSPYDVYITGVGGSGHGAVVMFYSNRAGYVSKILITSSISNDHSKVVTSVALTEVLSAIGLDLEEMSIVAKRLFSEGFSDVWVNNIKRRIIMELTVTNKMFTVKITASDV